MSSAGKSGTHLAYELVVVEGSESVLRQTGGAMTSEVKRVEAIGSLVVRIALVMLAPVGVAYAIGPDTGSQSRVVTMRDGTMIEVAELSERGSQVFVRLSDGRMFAYEKNDIEAIAPGEPQLSEHVDSPSATPAFRGRRVRADGPVGSLSGLGQVAADITLLESAGKVISLSGTGEAEQSSPATPMTSSVDDMAELIEQQQESHRLALEEYEKRLMVLVEVRDELIEKDYQATRACSGFQSVFGWGTVTLMDPYGGFWSGAFNWGGFIDNYTSPTCQAILADCDRLSYEIFSGLEDLALYARQNGVLPGEARAFLNRHALNVR